MIVPTAHPVFGHSIDTRAISNEVIQLLFDIAPTSMIDIDSAFVDAHSAPSGEEFAVKKSTPFDIRIAASATATAPGNAESADPGGPALSP
ncbi:hypothetical protein AB0G74_28295 [Streptomyces sp. NPDC020875]|uniref:hypothetical protein n=1 Tax=Streptomyces sp. NPDC020875 TaxID=3154898 RepID=UPI0034023EA4